MCLLAYAMRSFDFLLVPTATMPVIGKTRSYGPIPPRAAPGEPFWMESIKHQGIAPFSSDPASYKVFRNVKDFGAVGNGIADDTAAIKYVICI